jgi:F-box/leucine-rich repeat protein 2/20
MPKLRHLSMIANSLSNPGLEAILDGCPLLEFLDLQRCFHLYLSGRLGKRCRDRIKTLVLPNDIDEDNIFYSVWITSCNVVKWFVCLTYESLMF